MTRRYEEKRTISIHVAVRRTGLAKEVMQECVSRQIVREPLTENDLIELRRIRRLQDLGVNMPGIEIILRMRRRIQDLQAQMASLEGNRPSARRVEWIEIEERWQRLLPSERDR